MQLNPLGQESVALSAPIAIVQDDGWHVPPTSPAGAPVAFTHEEPVGHAGRGGLVFPPQATAAVVTVQAPPVLLTSVPHEHALLPS